MKNLLGIVVLGLLLSSKVFAEISYTCENDAAYDDEIYTFKIIKKKIYVDGELKKNTSLKKSSSKIEFSYEWLEEEPNITTIDGVYKRFKGETYKKITHKLNLKTGTAVEIFEHKWREIDKTGKKQSWEPTKTDEEDPEIFSCYGGTLDIEKKL